MGPTTPGTRLGRICAGLIILAAGMLATGVATGRPLAWQPAAVAGALALPWALASFPGWRGYRFTAWIVAAVVAAMIYPEQILHPGSIDLGQKWLVLTVVQMVMFGMGVQMSFADFVGVVRMPRRVFIGVACQFTIMPLVGWALASVLALPDEIAAGIVLIGSCSSGLASNVMAYLARANLALSITMTAVATMLAPLATPLWMTLLAGDRVPIRFATMTGDIVKLVLVPIGAALLHDYLKRATPRGRVAVGIAALAATAWLVGVAWGTTSASDDGGPMPQALVLLNYSAGALLFGSAFHGMARLAPIVERRATLLSMFGIVYFTAIATAKGRDELLAVGALLMLAAVVHNGLGYALGYGMSRLFGLGPIDARTVALEVGMQNGGMAAGIANEMGRLGTMGLAAAVFSPWMNVSGSILANYWRSRPTDVPDRLPVGSP